MRATGQDPSVPWVVVVLHPPVQWLTLQFESWQSHGACRFHDWAGAIMQWCTSSSSLQLQLTGALPAMPGVGMGGIIPGNPKGDDP